MPTSEHSLWGCINSDRLDFSFLQGEHDGRDFSLASIQILTSLIQRSDICLRWISILQNISLHDIKSSNPFIPARFWFMMWWYFTIYIIKKSSKTDIVYVLICFRVLSRVELLLSLLLSLSLLSLFVLYQMIFLINWNRFGAHKPIWIFCSLCHAWIFFF